MNVETLINDPFKDTDLTDREHEVMTLAFNGVPDNVIGSKLDLQTGTVKQYLWQARQKLGISRTSDLSWWFRDRLKETLDAET